MIPFLSCQDISDNVIQRLGIYAFDNVIQSLHPDEEDADHHSRFGVIAFRELLKQAVFEYDKYFSFYWQKSFPEQITDYTFYSNFDDYVKGIIVAESSIIYVPVCILRININGRTQMRSIRYVAPTLYTQFPVSFVEALARHPIYFDFTPEANEITSNSGVYKDLDYEKFLTAFELKYLEKLKSIRDTGKANLPIEVLSNLDDLYSERQTQWDTYIETNPNSLKLWGMRGF